MNFWGPCNRAEKRKGTCLVCWGGGREGGANSVCRRLVHGDTVRIRPCRRLTHPPVKGWRARASIWTGPEILDQSSERKFEHKKTMSHTRMGKVVGRENTERNMCEVQKKKNLWNTNCCIRKMRRGNHQKQQKQTPNDNPVRKNEEEQ